MRGALNPQTKPREGGHRVRGGANRPEALSADLAFWLRNCFDKSKEPRKRVGATRVVGQRRRGQALSRVALGANFSQGVNR